MYSLCYKRVPTVYGNWGTCRKITNFLLYLTRDAKLYFEILAIVFPCLLEFFLVLFWVKESIVWHTFDICVMKFVDSGGGSLMIYLLKTKRNEGKADLKYCVIIFTWMQSFLHIRGFHYWSKKSDISDFHGHLSQNFRSKSIN